MDVIEPVWLFNLVNKIWKVMAKIKKFDRKSQLNRERVRKHRLKMATKLIHENNVRERIRSYDVDGKYDGSRPLKFYEDEDIFNFTDSLRMWVSNHRITASAANALLKILNLAGFTFLPKDARTFMKTPTNLPIKILENGKIWYFGLRKTLVDVFRNIDHQTSITLDFNFDGLPVFKSSNLQFWPILASIKGTVIA